MRFNRKGQTVIEFLMTYGWILLVVIAAIGALVYFGVISPDMFMPEQCTFSTGMVCAGFKATSDGFAIALTNNLGKDIEINGIDVGGCSISGISEILKKSKTVTINQSGCSFGSPNDRIDVEVSLNYTERLTGITKSIAGSVNSKIQPGSIE